MKWARFIEVFDNIGELIFEEQKKNWFIFISA